MSDIETIKTNLSSDEIEALKKAAKVLARQIGLGDLELLRHFKVAISNQASVNQAIIKQAVADISQEREQRLLFATHAGQMIAADLARNDEQTLARFITALAEANKINCTFGLSDLDIKFTFKDNPEPPEVVAH